MRMCGCAESTAVNVPFLTSVSARTGKGKGIWREGGEGKRAWPSGGGRACHNEDVV